MSLFKQVLNATNQALQAVQNTPKSATQGENTMHITETKFKQLFPNAKAGIYAEIAKQIQQAGCETKAQQAMFIAQCAVECAGFHTFEENLNYSADGLLKVFPKYFNKNNVALYARAKQKIANRVYANRMGNGNEASGEGWKYRGRGLIQVTGKYNYSEFAQFCNNAEIVKNPDLVLSDNAMLVKTAVWYWKSRKLATYGADVVKVTKLINGGTHGLSARQLYFQKLMN